MFATQKAGIETVWANEVDNKCCDTLEINFPGTQVSRKSIADIDSSDVAEIPDGISEFSLLGNPLQVVIGLIAPAFCIMPLFVPVKSNNS